MIDLNKQFLDEIRRIGGCAMPSQLNHILNIKSQKPHIKTWFTALYMGKMAKKGLLVVRYKNNETYYCIKK